MQVIDKRRKAEFKDLKPGDVFQYGGFYYLKVKALDEAVFLRSGDKTLFYPDEIVTLVKGAFVVEGDL